MQIQKRSLSSCKKVVRYLKETIQIGLIFGQESNSHLPRDLLFYGLTGYADKNFARDPKDWKLVMDDYIFFNKTVVSWSSRTTIFSLIE